MERGNPVPLFFGRQQAARSANGGAGIGCWKKRMRRCNGVDTGLNVTRHESEPTSDWSYIAPEVRPTAADAYREGNSGGMLGQGESLAMAPHPLVLGQAVSRATRRSEPRS